MKLRQSRATPSARAHRVLMLAVAWGAALGGAYIVSACGGSPSPEVSPIQVATTKPVSALPDTTTKYIFNFVDIASGQLITEELNYIFTGSAPLVTSDGSTQQKNSSQSTSSGLVSVGANFSDAQKEFTIQVGNRALGWIESGTAVIGARGDTGSEIITVKLTNINKAQAITNSDAPVAMTVADANVDASGKFTSAVSVATATKTVQVSSLDSNGKEITRTQTIGVASLSIGSGVVGKATDGTLASGKLKVATTYFSNADSRSMDAFPGGFAASVTIPAGTSATLADLGGATSNQSGSFITGGFAQFNVTDASGKAIKNFDPPITVAIDLPKGTKAADGLTDLKAGDEYPVWSYDESKGEWKFEKMGIVAEKTPVDASNFTVKFATNHLSSWNLDYFGPNCIASVSLTGRPIGDNRPLTVEFVGVTGTMFSKTKYGITDSALTFYNAPKLIPVNIRVLDGSTVVGTLHNASLCTPNQIEISLQPRQAGNIVINSFEVCPNGTGKRNLPTYTFLYGNGVSAGAYAVPLTAELATANFSSISVNATSSPYTAYALNPRTWQWQSKQVNVVQNQSTVVDFGSVMACAPVTGAN